MPSHTLCAVCVTVSPSSSLVVARGSIDTRWSAVTAAGQSLLRTQQQPPTQTPEPRPRVSGASRHCVPSCLHGSIHNVPRGFFCSKRRPGAPCKRKRDHRQRARPSPSSRRVSTVASGELWVAINRARATPIAGARAHVESGTVVVLQLHICCSRVQPLFHSIHQRLGHPIHGNKLPGRSLRAALASALVWRRVRASVVQLTTANLAPSP